MDEAELLLWRIDRLQAAVDDLFDRNLNEAGRKLGFKDGSYVGQMLRGARPITEKFIRKMEVATGKVGWFDPELQATSGSIQQQLRMELLSRDVPEHVLQTFLDVVRQYPPRQKAA